MNNEVIHTYLNPIISHFFICKVNQKESVDAAYSSSTEVRSLDTLPSIAVPEKLKIEEKSGG